MLGREYTLYHVRDDMVRRNLELDGPFPNFDMVTARNLKYDTEDAEKLAKRTMGCSSPQELIDKFPYVLSPYLT